MRGGDNDTEKARRFKLHHLLTADRRDSIAFLAVALILFAVCTTGLLNPSTMVSLALYPTPSARHDRWTADDLSKIAEAAARYPDPGRNLTLSDLKVTGLHYSPNSYALGWNPSAGGTPATYSLCANFDRSTTTAVNASKTYQNQDDSVYTVHHKGWQCYETDLGPYTGDTHLAN